MGGSHAMAPERYRERSPIHYVDRIQARLLIVQGANEPNVTPENLHVVEAALQRARAVREAGVCRRGARRAQARELTRVVSAAD